MGMQTSAAPSLDRKVLAVAGIVVLGAITTVLDATIVSVAVNTLAQHFNASLTAIQWLTTAYILTVAMVIPLTGWATARFGARRMWLLAVVLFTAGSLACGLAWSVQSMIVFRVVQGIGGGMIVPVGMTLVAQAAGPERVGRAMSIVGFPLVLGPVLGPVVGGLLIDQVNWRWIFIVNVPIGLIAFVLSWFVLDRDRPWGGERVDVLGFLLLCPGLALLIYGLVNITSVEGITSPEVMGTGLAGLALIALFILHGRRAESPLLDIKMFRNSTFANAAAIQFLVGATLNGSMLLFPLFYQYVHHESALASGLLLMPQGLGAAMMMPIAGWIVDRGKARVIVPLGIPLLTFGFVAYTQTSADSNYLLLGISLWIMGLGAGATMMPAMSTALRVLSQQEVPRANATFSIIQFVGAAVATAVFVVVLQMQLNTYRDNIVVAFNNTFWWPLVVAAIGIVPALLLVRRPKSEAAGRSEQDGQSDWDGQGGEHAGRQSAKVRD